MLRAVSPTLSENEPDISTSLFVRDDSGLNGRDVGLAGDQLIEEDGDDEEFIAATQAAVNRKNDRAPSRKSGAFQTMGLSANLLKAISRKGFTVPTPIQRKTLPLILDGYDVVGMARTGSGKTAAFVLPMIERLKSHSAKVGARAVILSPSRELALQTMKVVKDFARGTDLRMTLLVGGDSLEEQFESVASNPDIIIATPGRFEHLKVEMRLDLSSVRCVVFDEADRLFEMGFAAQLMEIMHSLPSSRQTLLFSATLPKSLVEFAKAGLQDPRLIRLDTETKTAAGLGSAFFTVKRTDKEGALLHILQDVIKMPVRSGANDVSDKKRNKAGNKESQSKDEVAGYKSHPLLSTAVFAATKHHVDYIASLLKAFGYATSYVYGSLDQVARKTQIQDFRSGSTDILVVTDVAARGIDIPVLANVINYDFPSQPKIFVHRVGRTARAGRAGWSYNLVTGQDMPYLLDLQLFWGRKLVWGQVQREEGLFRNAIVIGAMIRDKVEMRSEEVSKLLDDDEDLRSARDVAGKGEKQYLRTRNAASMESVKRAKELAHDYDSKAINALFEADKSQHVESERLGMLARVSGYRPQETIFEVGRRGNANTEMVDLIKKRRAKLEPQNRSTKSKLSSAAAKEDSSRPPTSAHSVEPNPSSSDDFSGDEELVVTQPGIDVDEASDSEVATAFTNTHPISRGLAKWQDSEHFMSYQPSTMNPAEDRGYGIQSGSNSNFVQAARNATMDLNADESKAFAEPNRGSSLRWDKKSKKYVSRSNDQDGSKGPKMITGESGQKIAASFRSGRFDAWRKANNVDRLPKVGEMERSKKQIGRSNGQHFKHNMVKAPKEADKYRDDYHKRRKRVAEAREKKIGRFADAKGSSDLKGVDEVRKARKLKAKRREKNARPGRNKT